MPIHSLAPVEGVFEVNDPNCIIRLTVTLGHAGQEGASAVQIGGIDRGHRAGSFSMELGSAADLDGQLLRVSTVVQDVANEHNDLSFAIEITACGQRFFERRERSVPNHGDGISIMTFIGILTA
ncbi:MAG: hypothetical protein WAT74_04680 [Flavobacteriales bacterium]